MKWLPPHGHLPDPLGSFVHVHRDIIKKIPYPIHVNYGYKTINIRGGCTEYGSPTTTTTTTTCQKGLWPGPLFQGADMAPGWEADKIKIKEGCWELGSIGTWKFVAEARAFWDLSLRGKVLPQLRRTSCEVLCGHAISWTPTQIAL